MNGRYSRRFLAGMLASVGAVITGLTARWGQSATPSLQASPVATPSGTPAAAATPPDPDETGATVRLGSIPEEGGRILASKPYVVTQPEPGTYMAFSTRCPHDNCPVGDIRNGEIICFCHGSRFGLDGSLRRGPARRRLYRRETVVSGGTMYVIRHENDERE